MTTSYLKINRQHGFSLIEALVAFLILSVGMLGIASLQTIALRAGTTATLRSAATMKNQAILERMRANPSGLLDYIVGTAGGLTAPTDICGGMPSKCTTVPPSGKKMALSDVYQWKQDILSVFPSTTTASITMVPGAASPSVRPQQVIVTINWKERDPSDPNATINMTYSTTQDM